MNKKYLFLLFLALSFLACKNQAEVKDQYVFSQDIKKVEQALGNQSTGAEVLVQPNNVPRVYVVDVPKNINSIEDSGQRKQAFFKMMLPLVLKVNEEILTERKEVMDAYQSFNKNGKSTKQEYKRVEMLALKYDVEVDDYKLKMETLLKKVGTISPSLALAQAAAESGWGTSRFAKHGNSLFGEWTYDGNGLVPANRKDGAVHRVKSFNTMLDAVRSYALMMNKSPRYHYIRDKRQEFHANGKSLDGVILAEGLKAYSELGRQYVKIVQSIIKNNQLTQLDRAKFAE